MNWKLNKRLQKSTLIIIHHDELKELIARMKHFTDIVIANQEYHEKIYKVYNDN